MKDELSWSKKRVILVTAILSSIISITIFCLGIYAIYSRIQYKECLDNQIGLISLREGDLRVISQEKVDGKIIQTYEGFGICLVREKGTGNISVDDINKGYIKNYQNYILVQMRIEDKLAEIMSYFNPRALLGEEREWTDKVYNFGTSSEYEQIHKMMKNNEWDKLSQKHKVIPVGNEYFIE